MTTLHSNLQRLLAYSDNASDMASACEKGVFYVVATPCMCSGYAIGSTGEDLPNLMATIEEAMSDNKDMIDDYAKDIENGDRDEDDEWEGEVLKATWDGSDMISLYMPEDAITPNNVLHTGTVKDLTGL